MNDDDDDDDDGDNYDYDDDGDNYDYNGDDEAWMDEWMNEVYIYISLDYSIVTYVERCFTSDFMIPLKNWMSSVSQLGEWWWWWWWYYYWRILTIKLVLNIYAFYHSSHPFIHSSINIYLSFF